MKLNDVVNDIDSRLNQIRRRLAESFGFDVSKYSTTNTKKIRERIRVIESRSDFSKHMKNPEWKRLSLINEYFDLVEKKGQVGQSKGDTAHEKMWKKMDQSGNANGFKGSAPKPKEDKYSQMAAKHGLEEGQQTFVSLMESELERAEIVLAARNIVDDVQDMIEDLSKAKVERLSPLVDRIKAEFGLDIAENFNSSVSSQLESALQSLSAVKDAIDTESLKLSGDVEPEAVSDFSEPEETGAELDVDLGDTGVDSGVDSIDPIDPEAGEETIEPLDRTLKENKVSIRVETFSGKKGRKVFESRKEMRAWLNINGDKIKRVFEVK